MTLSTRIFALTFMIAAIALGGLTISIIAQSRDTFRDLSLERLSDGVGREAALLQNHLDLLVGDAVFLAATDTVEAIVNGDPVAISTTEQKERLARVFQTVMRQRPPYTQIRLVSLDDQGMELVRVNRTDTGVTVVQQQDLQAKRDRYYLNELARLQPGDTYLSDVDLNREHGVIQEPHQPVFRIGVPVFDRIGRRFGAILINIDFDRFLGDIVASGENTFFVTNGRGDYLRHPDRAKEFRFEFGEEAGLTGDLLSEEQVGAWHAEGGSFQYYDYDQKRAVAVDRIRLPEAVVTVDDEYLLIGATASLASLEAEYDIFRNALLASVLVVGSLMAAGLSITTYRFMRPISRMVRTADRIADGERDVALPKTSGEIGLLASSLERMLAALRRAAKTEELASMGRMASMIAHDLRNALSAIKMNLQILRRRGLETDERMSKHCTIALDQVTYMEHVLNDMLIFAKPGSLDLQWTGLGEIIHTAVLSMLPAIDEKRLYLKVPNLDTLPTLRADRIKIIRVMQNLLENAVQAAPEGSKVEIRAGTYPANDASSHDGAPLVIISVIDQGPGVDPHDRTHIFEPFFTTKAKGTGLGLAIVKRIIDEHGGHISVAEDAGHGTVMQLQLPLNGPSTDPLEAVASGGGATVSPEPAVAQGYLTEDL
ncbi:ATP-binding protein [Caenispirillum salinarum]|uniref:sensor histidine kinase n=1 Tax=Caenispirillum salinarum TaxID=859058 RepID=UPI00384CB527